MKCHVHQEAFTLDIVEQYNLMDCNKSTGTTPFRSGFPVDNIAPSNLSSHEQTKLLKKYQQIIGNLNWSSISTRPCRTTIVSLLAAKTQSPAPAHYDSALHVVKYLATSASHGLYYTSDTSEPFHAFVHFPAISHHFRHSAMPTGIKLTPQLRKLMLLHQNNQCTLCVPFPAGF